VIPNPSLTLWLDEVAVTDGGAGTDLAPGEAKVLDGKLIVGCAAGSALLLKRARVAESAALPSHWSRAVDILRRSCVRVNDRRVDRPRSAHAEVPQE
jgi:hypothetical protein